MGDSDKEVRAQVMLAVDLTGKDGTAWRPTPPTATRPQQDNIVRSRAKPKNPPDVVADVEQAFRLFVSDKVLDIIMFHTNMEAERIYKERDGEEKWRPTDKTEILAYLGLVITAGHMKQNYVFVSGLWDNNIGGQVNAKR